MKSILLFLIITGALSIFFISFQSMATVRNITDVFDVVKTSGNVSLLKSDQCYLLRIGYEYQFSCVMVSSESGSLK